MRIKQILSLIAASLFYCEAMAQITAPNSADYAETYADNTPQLITVTLSESIMIASSLTGTNLKGQSYGGDVSDENQQPVAAVRAYSAWDDSWE